MRKKSFTVRNTDELMSQRCSPKMFSERFWSTIQGKGEDRADLHKEGVESTGCPVTSVSFSASWLKGKHFVQKLALHLESFSGLFLAKMS